MTAVRTRLPIRVPELGPSLGKVITGTGRDPGGFQLDHERHHLATRLFDAAGEARRLAARDERQAAVTTVGRTAWLEAWEEAVAAVADRMNSRIEETLWGAGRSARMPKRRLRRHFPDEDARRGLLARLGAAGVGLVPALDALDRCADAAVAATGLDRDAMTSWQDALRTAARRLDAAWIALEESVEHEWGQWERAAADIGRWRKPWWPVVLVGVLVTAAAVWIGLVLGGYVTAPAPLESIWNKVTET